MVWVFETPGPLAEKMPDGQYVIIIQQSVTSGNVFDMEKCVVCPDTEISCGDGTKLIYGGQQNSGLHRICAAANVLQFCGEKKGFVGRGTLIKEKFVGEDRYTYGYIVGPLDNMATEHRQNLTSCLRNDIGHITTEMWYVLEWKGPPSSLAKVKVEKGTDANIGKKRKQGDDGDDQPAVARAYSQPKA